MQTLNNVKVSFNFNLRQPKRNETATQIYCVAKVGERQIKMPCGLKVYAYQWDKRKQICVVSPNMGDMERENNIAANRKINQMKCTFDEIFMYLCSVETICTGAEVETYIKEQLKEYTEQTNNIVDMANKNAIPPKRTITATRLLKEAFDLFYNTNGNQKGSTIGTQEKRLKKFFNYIEEAKKYDTPKLLTQEGLNDFKEWLINKANESDKTKMGANTINQFCQLIKRLINDVLAVRSEYRKYNIQLVKYVNIDDTRKKDERYKRALTENEVATFMEYEPEKEKEQEIKDLFTLQLNTGVRKGDLVALVNGKFTTDANEPEYIIVDTEKEGIAAVCEREHINAFNAKYPNGLNKININSTSFETTYNNGLKTIFKKAGLTQMEHYKENIAGRNVEVSKPLNEIISNHFGRHTFITFKLREGMRPDVLCYMTGHADDRMINEIYEHLTKTDIIRKVKQAQTILKGSESQTGNNVVISNGETANIIAAQAIENYQLKETIKTNNEWFESESIKNTIYEVCRQIGCELIADGEVTECDPVGAYQMKYGNIPSVEQVKAGEAPRIIFETMKEINLTNNMDIVK